MIVIGPKAWSDLIVQYPHIDLPAPAGAQRRWPVRTPAASRQAWVTTQLPAGAVAEAAASMPAGTPAGMDTSMATGSPRTRPDVRPAGVTRSCAPTIAGAGLDMLRQVTGVKFEGAATCRSAHWTSSERQRTQQDRMRDGS